MRIQREVNSQKTSREGFTLLEIMVGVGVLGMLLVTMYQLVGTQLMALKNSRDSQLESVAMEGLVRYVQGILANLQTNDLLKGSPHVYGMEHFDELQWSARSGMALLTSAAPDDEYALTLIPQPTTATSKQQDIGIRRRLSSEPDNAYEWIPLLSNVAGLEFQFYHPVLSQWQDRWEEDSTTRPSLVRMKVWRNASDYPFEVVIPVPSARMNNK